MADEELIIEALDEPELDDEGVEIVKAEPAKIITPDEGIEALRKQLDQAREDKRQAESRAAKAEEDAFGYQADNHDTNIRLLASSIADKERENKVYQAGLAEANAAGEYDKVAEIQAAMLENNALIGKFKDAHETLSKTKIEPPQKVAQKPSIDDFASSLPAKSASWIKAHPEFYNDPKLNSKLIHAHNFATTDHEYESPEYFAAIENMLGVNKIEAAASVKEAENPLSSAASEAPRVAPVSRGGNSKTVVTLSRAQREAAEASGMTEKEYAVAMLALQKEGRMGQTH